MKCLVVTNTDRMISLFFIPHIKLLQKMGYDVSIATALQNPRMMKDEFPEISLHHVPFTRDLHPIRNMKAYAAIKKLLQEGKYDIVHVHTPIAAFLVRMAAPKKQQIIYTAHGFHFHEHGSRLSNWIYYVAEKVAASKTRKLIVINEEDFQSAQRFLPIDKIHYIHGVGLDADRFNPRNYSDKNKYELRKELGISNDTIVITHLAEFNENKRQIDIVLAAEELKKHTHNFVVLLLGDGSLAAEIKNEITNRKLEDYVFCLGYRGDIDQILSVTDIGLLVSLREGLPKSVMEMMAMEIPLIVTDIRGNRDLVIDEKNGYVIPIRNPKALMEACLRLIHNGNSRMEMGKRGRERILDKFELDLILVELEKIYEVFISDNAKLIRSEGEQSAQTVTIME
ncbi:glycosyltransferase family 4 protein [Ornithinibacillus scapharcae]|uniref:glycosyltransferase family 4 protein n=1 Tax=Ornithinibacillus scapharcae TaxID=1147159 RepID=UPI000225B2D6|nr:glycosyltransferase family 4 protein [Ornithinibacillus scapharcae]